MYLNCHSQFSFRYGTLKAKTLIELAHKNGHSAIALTDINNTSACTNFIREAKKTAIKPVVGVDFRAGAEQCFVGLAQSNLGFQKLNEYLSSILAKEEVLSERCKQLSDTFIIYPFQKFEKKFIQLESNEYIGINLSSLKQLNFSPWVNHLEKLVLLQEATINSKRDFNIHRLLRAIDNNTLLSKLDVSEQADIGSKMLPVKELEKLLEDYPFLVQNTKMLLEKCKVDFDYRASYSKGMLNENREAFTGSKEGDTKKLRKLCYDNLNYRYPDAKKRDANIERLESELQSIKKLGFEAYFLINWDMLRFAREQNFFYVGRGSGANSIVAYLLRITDVDPVQLDLYFERFINPYRESPPDFDIDFSWKDRDVVTEYLFEKYGDNKRIALLATYNTFQYPSLIRELGKVFGLPKNEIDALAGGVNRTLKDEYVDLIYKYANYMHGMPSHLSIHAGGIVISEKPIHYFAACNFPPKGFPLMQIDMIHAEDVGLYKFDILSQRGLGKVKDSVEMVKNSGKEPGLDIHLTERFYQDEKIKKLLSEGDTMGCFYVESPAMRMLLKKLKAESYSDLVAASSIIRPGVANSGMMREYILRSHDPTEEWKNHTPDIIQNLMHDTYGVMVYQEDVIKVAHHFAELSLKDADVLRRGMSGKFRSREEFTKVKEKFFVNCKRLNYSEDLINNVWRQIESFGGYAFAKGHSASYAVESYQSLYLKAYYPMEFIVGVINNGGGFYTTEMYFHEARMLGAIVEPPCINSSEYLSCLKGEKTIYMGFRLVAELEIRVVDMVLAERRLNGSFGSLLDFINRCSISIEQLSLLIRSASFRFTNKSKQELLWEMYSLLGAIKKNQSKSNLFQLEQRKYELPVLDYAPYEEVFDQIELFGFPLCSPFNLLKDQSFPKTVAADIINYLGKQISIVGYLVTIKNTATSNKKKMQFGTFIDLDGKWIDTVHFPPIVSHYPFSGKGCYLISGKVVEEFGYATIEVQTLKKLSFIERDEGLKVRRRIANQ